MSLIKVYLEDILFLEATRSFESDSSVLFPSQEHCHCYGCSLEAVGQGSPHNHCSVPECPLWQHGDVLSPVRNTVILLCFDAVS